MFEVLGILSERHDVLESRARRRRKNPAYLHLLVRGLEAWLRRPQSLSRDPAFVNVPAVTRCSTPPIIASCLARIQPGGTLASRGATARLLRWPLPPARDAGPPTSPGWTATGNAVALTTTMHLEFGAHLLAGRTGVLLNNEMDDFSLATGVPDAFGLVAGDANLLAPGKRAALVHVAHHCCWRRRAWKWSWRRRRRPDDSFQAPSRSCSTCWFSAWTHKPQRPRLACITNGAQTCSATNPRCQRRSWNRCAPRATTWKPETRSARSIS